MIREYRVEVQLPPSHLLLHGHPDDVKSSVQRDLRGSIICGLENEKCIEYNQINNMGGTQMQARVVVAAMEDIKSLKESQKLINTLLSEDYMPEHIRETIKEAYSHISKVVDGR